MKKEPPLLPTIFINRFERSCGTFRGGEEKTHCHQRHWGNLPKKKKKPSFLIKNNNDHGVVLA